ncbi:6484_t:CDS:2, partial [Dentiscutata heterogama]
RLRQGLGGYDDDMTILDVACLVYEYCQSRQGLEGYDDDM